MITEGKDNIEKFFYDFLVSKDTRYIEEKNLQIHMKEIERFMKKDDYEHEERMEAGKAREESALIFKGSKILKEHSYHLFY